MREVAWRTWSSLLFTAPGRCRLRRMLMGPVEPALYRVAGARRRRLGQGHCLVAVTGTFGKTTTVRAIRCALGLPVGLTGGANAGDALARALLLTPQRSAFSVFEAGVSQPGDMLRTAAALQPTIAVVTSIGDEHSASFGTRERTREEKFELVRAVRPEGTAILNGDDPHVRWMADRAGCRIVTFGRDADVDVRAESIELDWPHGTRLTVRAGDWRGELRVRLLGDHLVPSVLAALAVARAAGVDLREAAARLATLAPTPGRMQIVALPGGAHLIRDEYKSGLETIERALEVFARVPATRRVIVLGEITEPPSPQHPRYVALGQQVAPLVDTAIIFGKTTAAYRTGLRRGGLSSDRIINAGRSWRAAFEALRGQLRAGDVVLLKGRHDERLERVALALMGEDVGCDLVVCHTPLGRCDTCSMLRRGWGTRRPVL